MYSLILDSATKILYVALLNDNKVVYEKYVSGKNDHAKNIVFCVDEALKTAGIETEGLDEIVVGVGPGSYTGVRMAVAVAKMMATFKHIKLYTISTLKMMASGVKGKVLSMIDARRGNAFACVIDTANNNDILAEGLYEIENLNKIDVDYKVNDMEYSVDPIFVLANKVYVDEPHLLTPNYLRDTEAERNLK